MKGGFPNSAEACQNFVTKYKAVSIFINNIFFLLLTCQLGLSSATYEYSSGWSCWSPEGISEHESTSDYCFSRYQQLNGQLPVNIVLLVLHYDTRYVLQQKSSNIYHTAYTCSRSSDEREFFRFSSALCPDVGLAKVSSELTFSVFSISPKQRWSHVIKYRLEPQ